MTREFFTGDPLALLAFQSAQNILADRELRLLGCWLVRLVPCWSLKPAVESALREAERVAHLPDRSDLLHGSWRTDGFEEGMPDYQGACYALTMDDAMLGVTLLLQRLQSHLPRQLIIEVMRDVIGSDANGQSIPTSLDVQMLAHSAYDRRLEDGSLDSLTLAALADALEEAGCQWVGLCRALRGGSLQWSASGPVVDAGRPSLRRRRFCGFWALDAVLRFRHQRT